MKSEEFSFEAVQKEALTMKKRDGQDYAVIETYSFKIVPLPDNVGEIISNLEPNQIYHWDTRRDEIDPW
jgi:hypothetical protein